MSLLEDGWLPLLAPFPWGPFQSDALKLRGSILFRTGARLLECDEEAAAPAGAVWSLVDGARHCSDAPSRALLLEEARSALVIVPKRMPARLRALTILAALGAAELGREPSAVGRLKSAALHRFLGTFPRA